MPEEVEKDAERDLLAAELALGLLDGPERSAAQRLRLSDPAFAAAVEDWATRLAPLGHAVPPASAPASLWPAIDRRLQGADELPAAPFSATAPPADLTRRLRRWQLSTMLSGAVAAALALALVLRPQAVPAPVPPGPARPAAPEQVAVAQLSAPDGAPLLAASYNVATGELRIRAIRLPEGRKVPELWIIPSDGTPRSLGFIDANGTSTVAVARRWRGFVDDQPVLAVTLENPDPQPHAAPTGDILASGTVLTI